MAGTSWGTWGQRTGSQNQGVLKRFGEKEEMGRKNFPGHVRSSHRTPPAPHSDLSTMASPSDQASRGQQGWSAGWRMVRVPSLRAK